jgi:hypothetical protein
MSSLISYCITDDESIPDASGNHIDTPILFKDSLNNDFRLDPKADDPAIRLGLDLSTDDYFPFDKDISGNKIDDTWQIGASHFTRELRIAIGNPSYTDLKTGTPTIIIEDGILTFSEAQNNENLCSGCFVLFGLGQAVVLYEKIIDIYNPNKKWLVTEPITGSANINQLEPISVGSITVQFNNLYQVLYNSNVGFPGLYYSNNDSFDYIINDLKATVYCSYGPSDLGSKIHTSLLFDETRNLTIKTPNDKTKDCNISRRHYGVYDSRKWYATGGTHFQTPVAVNIDYVTLDGLQLSSQTHGITVTTKNYAITNNILFNSIDNGINIDNSNPSDQSIIANNLIYNYNGSGLYIKNYNFDNHNSKTIIYSNTIIGGEYGIKIEMSNEFKYTNEAYLKNNLVQDATIRDYFVPCLNPNITLFESCWSSDTSIFDYTGRLNKSFIKVHFSNKVNNDYRLTFYDSLNMPDCAILSTDPLYQIYNDFKNCSNSLYKWTVGCDNYAVINYRIVNFSVGNNSFSPSFTATIKNSILTFSSTFSNPIGVGDKIEYSGGTCYLSDKGTSNIWAVRTATGDAVADVTDAVITSIQREATDIPTAFADLEANVTKNVTNFGINVFIWCYNDSVPDTTPVIIDTDWICDSDHKIQILTPYDHLTQCKSSQRNAGIWTSSAYTLNITGTPAIILNSGFIDIIGLQIETVSSAYNGINLGINLNSNIIKNNIIRNVIIGINGPNSNTNIYILNNLIYGSTNGIAAQNVFVYNNTVIATTTGINLLLDPGSYSINNIVGPATITSYAGLDSSANISYCIAHDATAIGSNCFNNVVLQYVDPSNKDYHLNRADWQAINQGLDINNIGRNFSIGFDDNPDIETIQLYFSISPNTNDFKTSIDLNLYVTISGGLAIFSLDQVDDNVGVGNSVIYNGTNECFLSKRISYSQWEVIDKFGRVPTNIINSPVVSIKHKFNDINTAVESGHGIKLLLTDVNTSGPEFNSLKKSKYQINLSVYKSNTFYNTSVVIQDYECDEDNYLKIYTPYDLTNECNTKQRHNGWYHNPEITSAAAIKKLSDVLGNVIDIQSPYIVIEGLIIICHNNKGVSFENAVNSKVVGCIIEDPDTGIINNTSGSVIIANNIIYGCYEYGIKTSGNDIVYNNTIVSKNKNGIYNSSTDTVINNIVDITNISYNGYNDNTNIKFCLSRDASAGTNNNCQNNITLVYKNVGLNNYITSNNEVIDTGMQLVQDSNYGFSVDSKGYSRPRSWGLGANEFEPVKVFYAIGMSNNDFSTKPGFGGLNFSIVNETENGVNIFSKIIFTTNQVDSGIGVGNQVKQLGNPDFNCILKEKINNREWVVTDFDGLPLDSLLSGQVGSINRIYGTLYESVSDNKSSLVSKNIQLNLVCYNDSVNDIYPVDLTGFVCDKRSYLRIFTPHDNIKEVNSTQRHDGNINNGYGIRSTSSGYMIYASGVDYLEIEGLCIKEYGNNLSSGIVIEGSVNTLISKNIIEVYGDGVNITNVAPRSNYFIVNNLIYNCYGDGIKIENLTATTYSKAFIYNNTMYNCRRGVCFSNPTYFTSPMSAECIDNICQNSRYQDFVCDYFNSSFFLIKNCISKDYSAGIFGGTENYKNTIINFANKDNENFYLGSTDYPALKTGLNLLSTPLYFFNDDNTDMIRDWDRGAFEMVNVAGTGELVVTPVTMECSCAILDTAPTLVLHLRKDIDNLLPDVLDKYQFFTIDGYPGSTTTTSSPERISLNEFLDLYRFYDSYNIEINIQGGMTVPVGEFKLRPRGTGLSVIIQTYPPELKNNSTNIASLIYPEDGMVDTNSNQKLLTFKNIKIYSTDDFYDNYLIQYSGTHNVKFVNCIVQLNLEAISIIPTMAIEAINTTFIYRNSNDSNTLFLVNNIDYSVNRIYNSEIITYRNSDISFSTSQLQTNDIISNVLTYNYSSIKLLTINNVVKPNCLENTDPVFEQGSFYVQDFDVSVVMACNFKPELNSPVFDAGNNNFVIGIDTDIINNNRIFNRRIVDIGPYELQIHNLTFKSTDIESIYQDKLFLMDELHYFKGTELNLYDLYYNFYNNTDYRIDFARESKIIMVLKEMNNDFILITDKEDILVSEFEAYYDNSNSAIVITKNNAFFGNLFNNIFKDSRYSFKFDEANHKFSVYLIDTFNKGASGDKNFVNNVRFGGAPVLIN